MTACDALTEATYEVAVQDRSTGAVLGGCRFTEGTASFNRGLNIISQAEITTPSRGCECECIPEDRSAELAFYRSDQPEEPVWVGPITRVVDDPAANTIRIAAFDRLYWAEGAPASRDIVYSAPNEIDIVELFDQLMTEAVNYEDPVIDRYFGGKFGALPPLGGLLVESSLQQNESVWSVIAGLSKSALDFTMVGPHLYWGSPTIPIERGSPITSDAWETPPIIDRDFGSVGSRVIVTIGGGLKGIYPPLTETETATAGGKRTLFVADTSLNTQAEADAKAKDVYDQNSAPVDFVITGDGSLSSRFPGTVADLVPGRLYPVTAFGQCLQTDEDLLQLFNVVVEIGSRSLPGQRMTEARVAADFAKPGVESSAERVSA